MEKETHEIRDPVHGFVHLDSDERRILNSAPVQRLRYIHQLALTYLIYPGATHRRFEHSLGVMELAGRAFKAVTHPENLASDIKLLLPELKSDTDREYWRRVIRVGALCHDIGHLPFSHAAEKELLPAGWDHERLTKELILSDEMQELWASTTPRLRGEDVLKLALKPEKTRDLGPTTGTDILADIIVGDAFGVDRMDYLLRDSHHAGVVYGTFDQLRLIDNLRILRPVPLPEKIGTASTEPTLGIEDGGRHCSEQMVLARYWMFTQIYFHPVRRIYDIHLKDFLREYLPGGTFPTGLADFMALTDNEVSSALLMAAKDSSKAGHDAAERIVCRNHFKLLYEATPDEFKVNPEAGKAVYAAACGEFGEAALRNDRVPASGGPLNFPIRAQGDRILSSIDISKLFEVPLPAIDLVFIEPSLRDRAADWLKKNRDDIIRSGVEKEEG